MISNSLTNNLSSSASVCAVVLLCLLVTPAVWTQPLSGTAENVQGSYFVKGDRLFHVLSVDDTISYSAWERGGITDFDTSNPFRILVFSAPFQKIYYLDNRLVPLSGDFSLSGLGLGEVTCVCASRQGGFWVYDRWQEKLIRFDAQAQRVVSSENFSILGLTQVEPVKIREVGNQLYVCCMEQGGYRFDLFGNYICPDPAMRPEDF